MAEAAGKAAAGPGDGPPVRANRRVPGHDGTPLATDVYRPDGPGPVPVVVTRTPHGRHGHLAEGLGWRRRGFAFVAQDVRGRYDSDGTWRPYRDERADGAALVAWLRAQPWGTGPIVASGGSYAAFTAWALALAAPTEVQAVISSVPAMGLHRVKFDPGGVLRLAEHANWWLERADSRTSRDGLVAAMHAADPGVLAHLPVCDLPRRLWADLPGWNAVVAAGPRAAPPDAVTDEELAGLAVASLHVGGWYDLLVTETLHQWSTVGAGRTPRPPRTLVVGPWGHDLVWAPTTTVGDRTHAPASRLDLGALQVAWLRSVLGHAGPGATAPRPSEVYVIGEERWTPVDRWPPAGVTETAWHPGADGTLTPDPPDAPGRAAPPGGPVRFPYDPLDPMPSRTPGADRAGLDGRADAARFRSAPLADPLTLLGTPRLHLVGSTTAPGADWVVRLNERSPEGRVFALTQGVATGHGELTVPLGPVAATLPAGARLELEVTGSDFPYLARNLNTGADRYTTAATAAAEQAVHVGGPTGTRLVLPTRPPS